MFHKEAVSLAAAGYDVVHLAPGEGATWQEQGVKVQTYVKRKQGVLRRIRNMATFALAAASLEADCYHCNEMESWLVGCMLKLAPRKKVVIFDVHEHYPSRASEPHFPMWFRWIGGPVVRLLYFLLTPWTDALIFAKRNVSQEFKGARCRSEFIYNYAPLDMQGAAARERESQPVDSITAIHIGGMSRARGWPQLLEALSLAKCKRLSVVLVGGVHEGVAELRKHASALGVQDRLRIVEPVAYRLVFDHLARATFGLILYQPGILNHVYAFPIKMYEYMLAGLPFIAPNFAVEVEPVVRSERCGLLVDTANPKELADAMDWLCDNYDEARRMGERGKAAVLNTYNWQREKEKLLALYADFEKPHQRAQP